MFWLNIITSGLAACFLIIGQFERYSKDKKGSWMLWLAIIFSLLTITSIVVENITGEQSDRERKADILLSQKMVSPIKDLGIEFSLSHNFDSNSNAKWIQFATSVIAEQSGSNLWADYTSFSIDSNQMWSRSDPTQPNLKVNSDLSFQIDSARNLVRCWLTDFGLHSQGHLVWRPNNLADIQRVVFNIHLSFEAVDSITSIIQQKYIYSTPPISSISLYANTFDLDNKLVTLYPTEWRQQIPQYAYYLPKQTEANFIVNDSRSFRLNLLTLRDNILKHLESIE